MSWEGNHDGRSDDEHVHLPTPGELYSSTVGSAITTVIDALATEYARVGGTSRVLVVEGREHEPRSAELITFRATRDWLSPRERVWDVGTARIGLPRRFASRMYTAALEAVPVNSTGPVFLHNAPAAVPLLRRMRPRAKPVLYVHNHLFRSWGAAERRRLLKQAHRIVFVSHFLRKRFLEGRSDPANVTGVVLNGASPEWFSKRVHVDTHRPTILFVGRVTPEKGVDHLLRACNELWARGLDFRLQVVGRELLSQGAPLSPFEVELRRLAAPFADRVEFTGFLDRRRIGEAYAGADIACVPSVWEEPCSLTLPEALVAGLPAIAARRGGLPEVGGDAAVYFDPSREGDLVRVLGELVRSADRRDLVATRCGARGQELTWASRLTELRRLIEVPEASHASPSRAR